MGSICIFLESRQLEQKNPVQYTYSLVIAAKKENKDFHFQLLNLSLTHFCDFGQATNNF